MGPLVDDITEIPIDAKIIIWAAVMLPILAAVSERVIPLLEEGVSEPPIVASADAWSTVIATAVFKENGIPRSEAICVAVKLLVLAAVYAPEDVDRVIPAVLNAATWMTERLAAATVATICVT